MVKKKKKKERQYAVTAKVWVKQSPPIKASSMAEAKRKFCKKTGLKQSDVRVRRKK